MKNPTTFIAKDGVTDADLMRAARDMYEALKSIELTLVYADGRVASILQGRARAALANVRGFQS